MPTKKTKNHQPVLLEEVINTIKPKKGETYLDLTAGYGGHAREILSTTQASAVLVDRDENAIAVLQKEFSHNQVELVHLDFLAASTKLQAEKRSFDLILADIGLSSPHIDIASRGFSIQNEGPLDMRMDPRQEYTAADIVNNADKQELTRILKEYGEEPKAKRIAQLIIDARPISTTTQLAQVVAKAWPGYSRVHPATRTFQAIRIAVNDELEQLAKSLPIWEKLLNPGGRLAVISFHSLEDTIVKKYFSDHGGNRYDASLDILTKKPIVGSPHELVFNPRARSARLRVAKRK
jgi:16S rRNA (cytosine1402-N4)-methyltransferase